MRILVGLSVVAALSLTACGDNETSAKAEASSASPSQTQAPTAAPPASQESKGSVEQPAAPEGRHPFNDWTWKMIDCINGQNLGFEVEAYKDESSLSWGMDNPHGLSSAETEAWANAYSACENRIDPRPEATREDFDAFDPAGPN